MKKSILRIVDPFHDEIEIDRGVENNFEFYSEIKKTQLNKDEFSEESNKSDDHNQLEVNEKENCKNSASQDLSKEKSKNIPHAARYSLQLEKTKALNAQHGSLFLKSPKEDRRFEPAYKMNKTKSLIENVSNNLPKQSITSETINQEFFKRIQASPDSQPSPKPKKSKTTKCRNSMKISSRRNFSKTKKLFSLRKGSTKMTRNQSKMSLTMKEIIEEISAALFDSEEFVKKFQNLVNVTTKENKISDPKLVCNFNSKENNLKETKNSDLTEFNDKIFKTRQPETIIQELIESIKERYRHHNHLPAKFIFPIIHDEPENLIHKYEFLTYETYLKTSISCDPSYKMICSNRSMTPNSLETFEKKLNANQEDKVNNWDDGENRLVINEEICNEELPASENLTYQLQNKRVPSVITNNTPEQTASTIDSINVQESQNRKTPNVNIILKAPSVVQQNFSDSAVLPNLAPHLVEKPDMLTTSITNNEFKTKLTNQTDSDNNLRLSKMRKLDEDNAINYNDFTMKQIEEFELKKTNEYKRAIMNSTTISNEYNNNQTAVQKTRVHTESPNNSDYVSARNGLLSNPIGPQHRPLIRNNHSNPVREQMHSSSGHYNQPQFPINLRVDPPVSNNNNGIERGLNYIPQIGQSKIVVPHPKYPIMPNTDSKIFEHRLQLSSLPFQQPCNLSTQTQNQIYNFSRNNPPRQCMEVSGMISQQPISSNLETNSRLMNNDLVQYQQNSQFNSISQANYQSQAPTLSNNRQYTFIEPGVSNHTHPPAPNHFNQQQYYYDPKELNYNQNFTQQYLPHNGNSSRSISEAHSKKFSTK